MSTPELSDRQRGLPMPANHPTPAEETRCTLAACRALLADDHFVYISGDHGSGWVAKDRIFYDMARVRRLTQLLAAAVKPLGAGMLCGPATGGLIVAQWTAYELGLPAVFAEHDPTHKTSELRGRFGLHRGYDKLVRGQRVLVVDDVVNTGLSVRQTADAVRENGGEVVAAACLVDRGNVDAAGIGVPAYRCLLQYDIPNWTAADCPLCKSNVPVNVEYAHGQDFVDAKRAAGKSVAVKAM
jgi:orotate phosphoribosyltransferase